MIAKVTIRKEKILADGKHPIVVRLTRSGKRRFSFTDVSVHPNDWDWDKGCLKVVRACSPSHRNWEKYQSYKSTAEFIRDKQKAYDDAIEKLVKTGRLFTFDKIFKMVEKPPQQDITVFMLFDIRMEEFAQQDNYGQERTYNDTYLRLKDFMNEKDLMFFELDAEILISFRRYLHERGNKMGTIHRHLRCLRAIWNLAINREIAEQNDYPFKKNKEIMKGLKTRFNSHPLTKTEIEGIRHLKPEDAPEGSLRFHARNYFMFMYLGHGHNIGDLARFKWDDIRDGRLYYTRYKTRNKVTEIGSFKITPEMQRILDWHRAHWKKLKQLHNPYIFPILNGFHQTEKQKQCRIHRVTGEINQALKQIGEIIGTQTNLTTYTARHSMANQLVRLGVDITKIKEILRHQNIQTTQHYIAQFDTEELDKAVANL